MFVPEDFERITPEDLPFPVALELLARADDVGYSTRASSDFSDLLKLDVRGEYTIFGGVADFERVRRSSHVPVAERRSFRPANTDSVQSVERTIFMVDHLTGYDFAGYDFAGYGIVSEMLTAQSTYSKDKPLVLGTGTTEKHMRKGFGHRRYLAMNAASLLIFGNPLHSREVHPLLLSESATRRWEALVREGLAESYEEIRDENQELIQRYRFKS